MCTGKVKKNSPCIGISACKYESRLIIPQTSKSQPPISFDAKRDKNTLKNYSFVMLSLVESLSLRMVLILSPPSESVPVTPVLVAALGRDS